MLESEDLCRLLFELSSDDRLNILRQLKKEAASVTTLSKLVDLTTQEASRQVFRLKKAGLLLKDQKGFYRLTSYAELVLKQLEGLNFVSRHKEYFRKHSLAQMPRTFAACVQRGSRGSACSSASRAPSARVRSAS